MGHGNEWNEQMKENKHTFINELLSLEQAILDGQMLSVDKWQAIPSELRKKSPLLLQAECEDGFLQGRLTETKQLLETALKGFAAQANESAMLAMMGMLGLLYEQVGDYHESMPIVTLLLQEWKRTPEGCSGFVPWALAWASSNGHLQSIQSVRKEDDYSEEGDYSPASLFLHAVDRFSKEGRPLWAAFVMLDRLLYDPLIDHTALQAWRQRLEWLDRHLKKDELGIALRDMLGPEPSISAIELLPGRYAYLSQAVLLHNISVSPEQHLASDIQIQCYAAAAAAQRCIQAGNYEGAKSEVTAASHLREILDTPAIRRTFEAIAEQLTAMSMKAAAVTYSEASLSGDVFAPRAFVEPSSVAENGSTWRIRLMGGIRFTSSEGVLAEPVWKRRRAGELLVFLLLQPGYKANREQLLERVFSKGEAAKRSNQLYVTLHDLRHTLKDMGLPEAVYAKRGVIGIEEALVEQIDVESYVALSRVGDQLWMDDREAACRLYNEAMLLYGLIASELPYAEWLEQAREQLLDRQTNMLKRLVLNDLELNEDVRTEQRLNEWIALRPDQEEAYETMIRYCLSKGHRAEAISWYKRLERIFNEELGIKPLEATRRLLWK